MGDSVATGKNHSLDVQLDPLCVPASIHLFQCSASSRLYVRVQQVNAAFREAAAGELKGILAVADEPLVSSDFKGTNVSSTVDAALTMCMGACASWALVL